jgi:hypothetical protein
LVAVTKELALGAVGWMMALASTESGVLVWGVLVHPDPNIPDTVLLGRRT